MKRFIFLSFFLVAGLAFLSVSPGVMASELDPKCSRDWDEYRNSAEDYRCVIQLREFLADRGAVSELSEDPVARDLYYPPTPVIVNYPPTPVQPIYYPPTPVINY